MGKKQPKTRVVRLGVSVRIPEHFTTEQAAELMVDQEVFNVEGQLAGTIVEVRDSDRVWGSE